MGQANEVDYQTISSERGRLNVVMCGMHTRHAYTSNVLLGWVREIA